MFHARHSLRLLVAAALLCGSAITAFGQTTYSEYQRRLEAARRGQLDTYRQWQADRLNRYEQLRATGDLPRRGTVLDLDDADIPAGSYDLQLPLGLRFRVNVGGGDGVPTGAPAWADASYAELHRLSRELEEQVRNLHIALHNAGVIEQYQPDIGRSREALDELTEAIEERESAREIGLHYQTFDELWHPVAYEIEARYGQTSLIGQRVATVVALDNRMHRLINIAPSSVYDRVRVAALTRQLAETTRRLSDEADYEARRSGAVRGIINQIDRVERHADDLHQTVMSGAAYSTVRDEYEQFDAAWHRLLDRARGNPQIDRYVRGLGREVWTLDRALHEELIVAAPVADGSNRSANLAAALSQTADHLLYDLQNDVEGRRHSELVDAAQNFALAVRNLHDELRRTPVAADARRELRLTREWWEYLQDQMRDLDRRRFEHSLEIAEQVEDQLRRLERSLG